MRTPIRLALLACLLTVSLAARAQSTPPMNYAAAATSKFITLPVLPPCMTLSIQEGDPAKGPLVVLAKFKPGCTVPWHFHSFNERLLIVSGTGKGEMKGESKPLPLKPGDYVLLPGKGIHQFTAVTNVELFLLSDGPFDIHYVDPAGAEIPMAKALKP
jgi:quercetin dioxygenase-like cupin family protein